MCLGISSAVWLHHKRSGCSRLMVPGCHRVPVYRWSSVCVGDMVPGAWSITECFRNSSSRRLESTDFMNHVCVFKKKKKISCFCPFNFIVWIHKLFILKSKIHIIQTLSFQGHMITPWRCLMLGQIKMFSVSSTVSLWRASCFSPPAVSWYLQVLLFKRAFSTISGLR